MGKQHILELNGRRYDALTGEIVSPEPISAQKSPTEISPMHRSLDGVSRQPKNTAHRAPEKSKTLMRKAVGKPTPPAQIKPDNSPRVLPSASTNSRSPKLASSVRKSPLVSRFGNSLAIKPSKDTSTPYAAVTNSHAAAHTSKFADAIHNAKSHEQPNHKKPRVNHRVASKLRVSPRVINSASFALALLIFGGFFTYQNIPGITMKLAASRSGVNGSLPSYQPAGFSLNGAVAYRPGQITINYKSNSDDRGFKVNQSASQWDSKTLLDDFVAINRNDYQTIQDKGKTVYIYDNNNATWVDSGIWYRIEGDSSLSSEQLLRIASSL